MGAQPYTEIYRLGDLPMPVGVRCRACGTTWSTIESLRAGDPGTSGEFDPVEGLETDDEPGPEDAPGPEGGSDPASPRPARSDAPSSANRQAGMLAISVTLVIVLLLVFLYAGGLFVPLVVLLMAAGLVIRWLRRPRP